MMPLMAFGPCCLVFSKLILVMKLALRKYLEVYKVELLNCHAAISDCAADLPYNNGVFAV